jgi:hypothetical protein
MYVPAIATASAVIAFHTLFAATADAFTSSAREPANNNVVELSQEARTGGHSQGEAQEIDAALLSSIQLEPGHEIKFYKFAEGDVGVNETLDIDRHTPVLRQFQERSLSAVELFRLIQPNAEVPESLVQADEEVASQLETSATDTGENEESESGLDTSKVEQSSRSTSSPSNQNPNTKGNWESWAGDEQWFRSNFCNEGERRICFANRTWVRSGNQNGANMRITGMAAGFDTRARFIIRSRGCVFLSCGMRERVNTVLSPRQYSEWRFSDRRVRYAEITPVSGESRVHFAMTYGGNNNQVSAPSISVSSTGNGSGSVFSVAGSGFRPNSTVTVRVTDDQLASRSYQQSASASGSLSFRQGISCISGLRLHFSATDGRANPNDATGVLWSNTVTTTCP